MACLLLSEQARLATLDLPPSFSGVMTGRGRASYECRVTKAGGRGQGLPHL
jgi:hypothetical protein